jgi:glycosyltransferase involved in cell wall biosynthesis
VCVCTYKRPEQIERLLARLATQETENLFDYSVVVVDNDLTESGRGVVEAFAREASIHVSYHVQPEQNISLARNVAIDRSTGDFIALIDDDEFPGPSWLLRLYHALHEYEADIVLGPVRPFFESEPPRWIVKGKICERPSFPTGTRIGNPKYTRTGNVLLRREILSQELGPFNPDFGRTGGEDVDFFKRMLGKGRVIAWCDEAAVHESVPEVRLKRSYFLKRALLRGVVNSENASLLSFDSIKSMAAFALYTSILPILFFWRHDIFMKYLISDCDHFGKILGLCGLKLVTQRPNP